MASSAFSFHCMICFEEFDPDTNYPVVLPCGHTYVCAVCADRLDKCMECRTPLTMACETMPPPPPSAPSPHGTAPAAGPDAQKENTGYADRVRNSPGFRRRYGWRDDARREGPPAPPPALKRRLPLPKNVVLLSLIRASDRGRRSEEVDAPHTPRRAGEDASMSHLVGSSPDDEEHKIRVGTYLEGGPCGTYAVAAKGGLLVYPTLFEHALPGALDGARRREEGTTNRDVEALVQKHRASVGMHSFDTLAALVAAASTDADDEVRHLTSLTDDDNDNDDDDNNSDARAATSARILPIRRAQSVQVAAGPPEIPPLRDITPAEARQNIVNRFSRHFSQGAPSKKTNNDDAQKDEDDVVDEFDRPLIRLKYGDRVQVVGTDTRGWVKLARGHGYIRLEHDKQLVKVSGPSDEACQIEATLHELAAERGRLQREQTKLERLAAGLMIDLQSSLIASDDDQVVVAGPQGSLRRSDSDSNLSQLGGRPQPAASAAGISTDDIDVSNRSRTRLTPRVTDEDVRSPTRPAAHTHREILTTLSHPTGGTPAAPPSPPRGPLAGHLRGSWSSASAASAGATPARVNFRTGLSGHRALTSAHSHPHDFIETHRGHRSMSHHAGISMNAYHIPHACWDSPCAGGT